MADIVRLVPLTQTFAGDVQSHASDLRVSGTTRLPHPYPEGGAQQWIASLSHDEAAAPDLNFAVLACARFVGTCGLAGIDRVQGIAKCGYWIAFDHWGKGYATAAGWRMIEFARSRLGLRTLHATTLKSNGASIRVLEKLGFTKTHERPADIPKWPPAEIFYVFEKKL